MNSNKFYLIGNPVEHSLSPIMQQLFFDYYKIDASYEALCIEASELKSTLLSLKYSGASGLNVTVPFKESITKYLDIISDEALSIGSVNTIKFTNGSTEGYNTDYIGFQKSLPISVEGENIIILGAGGSARAILLSLGHSKCRKVIIFNRTHSRAENLVLEFQKKYPNMTLEAKPLNTRILKNEIENAVLLINTSSVGMKSYQPYMALVTPELLHNNLFVYDLIYNPLETQLIKYAIERGLNYCNGLDMLIYQGLESLKIWLGEDLPFADSLINHVREVLIQELNTHG